MQTLAQKAFLGNGVQAAAPKQRCARRAVAIKAVAAPASTTLNTKRSEEVGLPRSSQILMRNRTNLVSILTELMPAIQLNIANSP